MVDFFICVIYFKNKKLWQLQEKNLKEQRSLTKYNRQT